MQYECVSCINRFMNGCCNLVGGLKGIIDIFDGNFGYFWVLTASNGDTFWLSFDRYCLLVGPKAKLIGTESDIPTLFGYSGVGYSKLGNSLVGFCLF